MLSVIRLFSKIYKTMWWSRHIRNICIGWTRMIPHLWHLRHWPYNQQGSNVKSNQVTSDASEPTDIGSQQASVNNVDQQSSVAGMGFRRQPLLTITNVFCRAGSMTSLVSDTTSGYNSGYRCQGQQRTRHRPKTVQSGALANWCSCQTVLWTNEVGAETAMV